MLISLTDLDMLLTMLYQKKKQGQHDLAIEYGHHPLHDPVYFFSNKEQMRRFWYDEDDHYQWIHYNVPLLIKTLKGIRNGNIHYTEHKQVDKKGNMVINIYTLSQVSLRPLFIDRHLRNYNWRSKIAEIRTSEKGLGEDRFIRELLEISKLPGGKEIVDKILRRYLPQDLWPFVDSKQTPSLRNMNRNQNILHRIINTNPQNLNFKKKVVDVSSKKQARKLKQFFRH